MDQRTEREIRSGSERRGSVFYSVKLFSDRNHWSSILAVFSLACFFALLLVGCKSRTTDRKEVAARAFDKELQWQQVYDVVSDEASAEDSAFTAENYIHNWVRQQAIVHHAEQNLAEERKDFSRQLEDYRNSLIAFAFEEEYVRQKLDTIVSEEEIEEYYQKNQKNFLLKDYIVRVHFCILDKNTPRMRKFERLFYSEDPEDVVKLQEFCAEYKANYFLDDQKWLYFDDLLKQIPLEVYNTESFLKKSKNIEFEDGNSLFYLNILEYKLKDSVSPLSFQKENIENIIINQRKVTLLNKVREAIYTEALAKKQIEIN